MLTNCLNCGAKKLALGTCERCGWDNANPTRPIVQWTLPRLQPGIHWGSILSLLLSAPLVLQGGLMMFTSRRRKNWALHWSYRYSCGWHYSSQELPSQLQEFGQRLAFCLGSLSLFGLSHRVGLFAVASCFCTRGLKAPCSDSRSATCCG